MKVIYDRETDTLSVIFSDAAVAESDQEKPGIILDYDDAGNLISLEVLEASIRVALPNRIDCQVSSNEKEPDQSRLTSH